jgi:hypothetical protein
LKNGNRSTNNALRSLSHPRKSAPALTNCSPRATAGEVEDLLKDFRKAFIGSAIGGELRRMLGYEKHDASGLNSDNAPTVLPDRWSRPPERADFVKPSGLISMKYFFDFYISCREEI